MPVFTVLLDPGRVNNSGLFWESGTLILSVLLFDTQEYVKKGCSLRTHAFFKDHAQTYKNLNDQAKV